MASGGPEEVQNANASIYHSTDEIHSVASRNSGRRHSLPVGHPEKPENPRGRRCRCNSNLARFLRFFGASRSSSRADRGPIIVGGQGDQEEPDEEAQLRPNTLYEPVEQDEGSEEASVDAACCFPCRRKSVRHRRNEAKVVGCSGDLWWYQNVTNRPVDTKEGIDAEEATGASTPPPLPPLPPALRGPDQPESTTASVHSQIDYQHYFIPDLAAIYACPYYWGVMDRYEAGEVLANKPSGSFLLRDSAQNNFIFSISFRGRGRTLHARIDVFRHSFSFDCCDPQVAKSPTVMGLLAKYQRREGVSEGQQDGVVHLVSMYEPTLKQPVFRKQTFTLQDLSRAVICTHFNYDQVQQMTIPWNLKNYMNIYHYKHQVGARHVSSES